MAMWVVQAHREGRWATWGLQELDLVIQRSRMGTVPSCTRAGLPVVAGRGSEVRRKSDKGDKPGKWSAKRSARVCGRLSQSATFQNLLDLLPMALDQMHRPQKHSGRTMHNAR